MKILINLFYRKKTHGGPMKTIKYLLTAILMVSTGLSAMEPAQELKPNTLEAHLLQKVNVPNENGELQTFRLPIAVANQIAEDANFVQEQNARKQQRLHVEEVEADYKKRSKYTYRPFIAGTASIPMLAAALLAQNGKYWLAGSALLTSGLIWYSQEDFDHNCHCTLDCYHYRNKSILGNLFLGFLGSTGGMPISALLYPLVVGLMAKNEYGSKVERKRPTGFLFGIKAGSVPLVPLFAQRLLEGTGHQWVNAGMLATAALASFSGLKDLTAYKRSQFKSLDAFLEGRDTIQLMQDREAARNQA